MLSQRLGEQHPEPELLLAGEVQEPADEAEPPAAELVLVVDDDPVITRLYSLYLQGRGFEVECAPDGEQAVERMLARPFDLVITDLSMPRLDGWGLIQRAREDARTRGVPILVLTAADALRDSLRSEGVGASAYVPKKTLPEVLMRIQALLAPRRELRRAIREGRLVEVDPTMDLTFVVRELAAAEYTGELCGRDEFAAYRVFFRGGQPVHAEGLAGPHRVEGPSALQALIASRGFSGRTFPGVAPQGITIHGPLEPVLALAHAQINQLTRQQRYALVAHGKPRLINRQRYRLLSRFGSARLVEIAHLVCGLRMSTDEVIRATDQSPGEVVAMVEELVRRGLVTMVDAG